MAARMKDIAKALKLSIVTVSKVLNKKDANISEVTRQRVLECARKLDYRTNLAARSLVTGESRMIGLIVPELFHGFFGGVAAGMSDALTEQGYGLIISSSRDSESLERSEIRQMLARSVDAIVVASCGAKPDALLAANHDVPVILLDRRVGAPGDFWMVGTNDRKAGELATQHLIDTGGKRIAYIGAAALSPTSDREAGFRAAIARSGMRVSPKHVVRLPQNEESNHVLGARFMRGLLELKPRPDAVFCYNDPTAWGAMQAIFEAGLRVPEDVAVVGCGGMMYNELLRVPLTSIDQNALLMGQETATLVQRAISERAGGARHDAETILLEPVLVVRGSTRPAAG
ncbi:MAG: LacI family transcriptional regulator [Acidobacteriota bacterium]|nr:LacI family transcriptional regulator [Acidobacteriota bacterium]